MRERFVQENYISNNTQDSEVCEVLDDLKDGTENVLKPIANDKPNAELGFDDPRIERKPVPIVGKLKNGRC